VGSIDLALAVSGFCASVSASDNFIVTNGSCYTYSEGWCPQFCDWYW